MSRTATPSDTIFALATGPGRAAIAIIRLSGDATRFVLETIAGGVPQPRAAVLRSLRDGDTVLDRALVLFFPGPASFTGEDSAEFHVHGGRAVVSAVLHRLSKFPQCRLAEPGEFARRALANGKMDLAEAEGLADLIDAETEFQRKQAMRQMEGGLSALVHDWRGQLIEAMALIEAEIDFSDEFDASPDRTRIALLATQVRDSALRELSGAKRGSQLRDGLAVVIAGPPNAGKSTLLNVLARKDVAIVSPFAGTTRDLIEVRLDIGGYPACLIDTAGLRETTDVIEQEGVARARKAAEQADIGLWLEGPEQSQEPPTGTDWIRVRTKADLAETPMPNAVSAKTGQGIDALFARLEAECAVRLGAGDATVTRIRQEQALTDAASHLTRALALCANDGAAELIAEDLRLAVRALDHVIGSVGVEDVLDALFSTFCIGK